MRDRILSALAVTISIVALVISERPATTVTSAVVLAFAVYALASSRGQ